MKVEVKKIDTLTHELKFSVAKETVSAKMDEVFKEISKKANIKGFRQGKAPRHVIEAQYGQVAREEVLKQVIPEAYEQGIEQEKLHPIQMPEISDVDQSNGEVHFTAKFEVKPEVKIKDYKGIKVKRKSSKVTDEELNKTFDYFKTAQGKDKDIAIDDTFAKGLGYPSLDEFKQSLTRQMEMDKERMNKVDVENQVVDALLKNAKLVTPQSLVKDQMGRKLAEQKQRLAQQGIPAEEIEKREEQMIKELKEAVEKDIRAYLVMDKIAEEEKMDIKSNENLPAKVMEFLMKEAVWEEAKK